MHRTSGSTNPPRCIMASSAEGRAKSPSPIPPAPTTALCVPMLPCLQPKGSSGAFTRNTGQNCSTGLPLAICCINSEWVGAETSTPGVHSASRTWNSVTSEGG